MSNRRRLLIVEDMASFSRLLMSAFVPQGFDVRWAPNGAVGLELAEGFLPNLVILDIEMPGISGLEVLERLRATWPRSQMAVLMSSGQASQANIDRSAELGADGFLKKPYAMEMVVERAIALTDALQEDPAAPEGRRPG